MLVLSGHVACTPEDDGAPQALDVTYNNVSGIWALEEIDGVPLPDELYYYIDFVRRDRTFTMYQNFESMYTSRRTGSFSITKDEYKGYILDGKYDYGTGNWNNAYIVTALFEEYMILTADTEGGETRRFVRCKEVPAEIINWFESGSAE